jgi:hypothetical protein
MCAPNQGHPTFAVLLHPDNLLGPPVGFDDFPFSITMLIRSFEFQETAFCFEGSNLATDGFFISVAPGRNNDSEILMMMMMSWRLHDGSCSCLLDDFSNCDGCLFYLFLLLFLYLFISFIFVGDVLGFFWQSLSIIRRAARSRHTFLILLAHLNNHINMILV